MNRLIFPLLLLIACAIGVTAQSGRRINNSASVPIAPVQPPANPLPDLQPKRIAASAGPLMFLPVSVREREIKAIGSDAFRLDDFHSKVLVINVWASWCGPCRREVPEYESVRKAYTARNVEFIGLTTEDPQKDVARVTRFLRDVSFGFRLGWADDEMAEILMNGRDAIPQTLVINADGSVIKHWTGYKRGQLKQAVDHALLQEQ